MSACRPLFRGGGCGGVCPGAGLWVRVCAADALFSITVSEKAI